ncbi:hypothetical protein PMAYCL1PPCAC_33513 [Pristionchus mayeri]|uniref:Membrane transporter n=1 Tax=Pristionchus mayeri TaxID=1317129 RepID=A0AAN5DGM7_9BILA|nr:hypothetical protein PMAYCL1PPCAC_21690 [Pristionchus mayeri]GMR63318.1 hypothetical protein PMAYCL1PPCAC_33513 [Pristionchus mayeri]
MLEMSNLKDSRFALATAIILGIAHMCMFVGFDTGSFIVESVLYSVHQRNPEDMNRHAGYYGQAIMYAFNMIGHIVAPAALCFMSAKWTMVLGSLFFTLSFASYIFENELIIYVSGALLGLFYAVYNAGYSRYLTQISTVHSIEKINGLEWSIACFGTLVGGLLIVPLIRMNPNSTKPSLYKEYSDMQVKCMFGAFTVIGILSNVIYCMLPTRKVKDCISSIAKDTKDKPKLVQIRDSILKTARAFFDPLVLQLSPHFFYVGLQCAVWLTIYPTTLQFTKHLSHSTYVITIYGCMFSIGEFAMGLLTVPLAKRINNFGQTPCLILSMVLQTLCFILILISTANRSTSVPNNDPTLLVTPNVPMALILGFLFGVLDSTNNTNRTVMCALAIPSKKAQVFAVARFYQALSAAIPLFLSAYLTTYRLLVIEFVICVIGAVFYLRVVHKIGHNANEEPTSHEAFANKESVIN